VEYSCEAECEAQMEGDGVLTQDNFEYAFLDGGVGPKTQKCGRFSPLQYTLKFGCRKVSVFASLIQAVQFLMDQIFPINHAYTFYMYSISKVYFNCGGPPKK
jgi:hypothetical protein